MAMAQRRSDAPTGSAPSPPDRWPMGIIIAGIVFTATFVAGILLVSDTPDYDDADQEWANWFDDSGNRWKQIIGAFLIVISALAFVVFITALVRTLRARGGHDGIAQVALVAGSTFAGLIAVAGVFASAVSLGVEIDAPRPSAEVIRTFDLVAFGTVLIAGALFAALCMGSVGIAARRSDVMPRWLAIASIVAGVIVLFSFAFFPMALLPLWALVTAIIVGRRATTAARSTSFGATGARTAGSDEIAATGDLVASRSETTQPHDVMQGSTEAPRTETRGTSER